MRTPYAFMSGLVFGIGLLLGGMADPLKVKAFLDVAGAWDPSLAFVMAGAIALAIPAFAVARRHAHAWNGEPMRLPDNKIIDARLLLGGALFGIGWGLAGFCPGPAIVALGSGSTDAAIFVVAMLVGMTVHDAATERRPQASRPATPPNL